MATNFKSNQPADTPVIRSMKGKIEVIVDIWDWQAGKIKNELDITQSALSYAFSKTLRTPMNGCTISLTPVIFDVNGNPAHALDVISVMDVVRIKEFGITKFQGYIRRVATNASMGADGRPQRQVVVTATHIGGLLQEAQLGYQILGANLKKIEEKYGSFFDAAGNIPKKIADKSENGGVLIKDIVDILIEEWFNLLDTMEATKYKTFLNHYIDFQVGMQGFSMERVNPTDMTFFYGSIDRQSFWTEIQKLAEVPFNEFFFDEGGHKICIEGKTVNLTENKTCFIGRPTPFNGSVRGGTEHAYFTELPQKEIKLKYLTRYDLAKSSEESYSVYLARPTYTDFTDYTLYVMGDVLIDDAAMNKYLLRPLTMNIFYATVAKKSTTGAYDVKEPKEEMQNCVQTLKNWYENNDKFLSGNISMMVPEKAEEDIYVGDKVAIEGLSAEFYVEGVSHTWTYGGPLSSSLSVSRGYNYSGGNTTIELKDKIFTAGKFPLGRIGKK